MASSPILTQMGFPDLPCYVDEGLDLGFPNCLLNI